MRTKDGRVVAGVALANGCDGVRATSWRNKWNSAQLQPLGQQWFAAKTSATIAAPLDEDATMASGNDNADDDNNDKRNHKFGSTNRSASYEGEEAIANCNDNDEPHQQTSWRSSREDMTPYADCRISGHRQPAVASSTLAPALALAPATATANEMMTACRQQQQSEGEAPLFSPSLAVGVTVKRDGMQVEFRSEEEQQRRQLIDSNHHHHQQHHSFTNSSTCDPLLVKRSDCVAPLCLLHDTTTGDQIAPSEEDQVDASVSARIVQPSFRRETASRNGSQESRTTSRKNIEMDETSLMEQQATQSDNKNRCKSHEECCYLDQIAQVSESGCDFSEDLQQVACGARSQQQRVVIRENEFIRLATTITRCWCRVSDRRAREVGCNKNQTTKSASTRHLKPKQLQQQQQHRQQAWCSRAECNCNRPAASECAELRPDRKSAMQVHESDEPAKHAIVCNSGHSLCDELLCQASSLDPSSWRSSHEQARVLSCKQEQQTRWERRRRKRELASDMSDTSFGVRRILSSGKSSKHSIAMHIVEMIFIYSLITSVLIVPAASTNYWPSIKASLTGKHQQQATHDKQQTLAGAAAPKGGPLLIGQHYNNFSSIVPYSIVQDSDYGTPMQEDQVNDQTMDEEQQEQQQQQQQQQQQPQPLHLEHHRQQHQLRQQQPQPQQQQQQLAAASQVVFDGNQHQHDEITRSGSGGGANSLDLGDANGIKASSRALLQSIASQLDSNRLMLPQMQQIKSRFNQGCVGGTKCQFFAFCWMSGGSLGASCGLLMTCCVTPSRQEIQPGFYGPVVNDPYCGRSTSKINRIVGGTDASFGQFPWQAFVQVGGSRCGGALISSRHVVTAGHCVARSQHSPSSIKVTLGDYILNSDIESIPHEVFSVVEVLLHPNFRFTPQADRYDVAVLELDRTASYKDNIKPICLPQKDAAFVGRVAYVAGWGALQAGSKLRPKVLQHVAVPVIENQVCESWHRRKGIDIRIYDEMMCAGYELGQRDACQGDSGGPLMLNQFGVWYLVGIVSAGYSCAKQYQPGIYHRVSSSSDWISSNIYQQGANK